MLVYQRVWYAQCFSPSPMTELFETCTVSILQKRWVLGFTIKIDGYQLSALPFHPPLFYWWYPQVLPITSNYHGRNSLPWYIHSLFQPLKTSHSACGPHLQRFPLKMGAPRTTRARAWWRWKITIFIGTFSIANCWITRGYSVQQSPSRKCVL